MPIEDASAQNTDEVIRVLAEATKLYDEEDYSAAGEAFLKAAMLAPPTRLTMTLLVDALKRRRRRVLHELADRYPTSSSVQLGAAESLVDDTFSNVAVRLCTQLLEKGELAKNEELDVRWIRFRATANSRIYAGPDFYGTLVEDFAMLWSNLQYAARSELRLQRNSLFEVLAAIRHPPVATILQRIRDQVALPSSEVEFLNSKIRELNLLNEMTHANS